MQRLLLIALTALIVGLPNLASQAVENGFEGPAKSLAGLAHHDVSLGLSSFDADTDDTGLESLATLGTRLLTHPGVALGISALACQQLALPPARAPPHCL
ncbi:MULTISPECIES: hypothetical protein [Halomonadaceae]|jgi:hypothetical protein|uniref:Uncharacterized protein n=1 Tax=Billgrantia aerodenitrificans TaxID=2733483 RepID=A0ABS9AYC5_9GAMM|nr:MULTISPECIES: hypothetical protein [Halomonas]MCE8026915.1 hypothetical protein [Halomonas aerodenitrificans]MCE8040305.1 hypothetical protein [Halomonas sp. MCCC 1A11062]